MPFQKLYSSGENKGTFFVKILELDYYNSFTKNPIENYKFKDTYVFVTEIEKLTNAGVLKYEIVYESEYVNYVSMDLQRTTLQRKPFLNIEDINDFLIGLYKNSKREEEKKILFNVLTILQKELFP